MTRSELLDGEESLAEADEPLESWRPGPLAVVLAALALLFVGGAAGWLLADGDGGSFGEVDVGFLDDMSVHHSGAITLGFDYLQARGDGPMGHFAREIIIEQSQEIAQMNGLLIEAGDRATVGDGTAMEWMGQAVPIGSMPGMATEGQLAELRDARDITADDLFSTLMIRHHAAGIDMAQHAAVHADDERVRRLARAMATVQHQEIAQMNGARDRIGLEPVSVEGGGHTGH